MSEQNKEFKRDFSRYMIFKSSDVDQYLTELQREALHSIDADIMFERQRENRGLLTAVVIEKDWPEYEPAWQMLERRMTGQCNCETDQITEIIKGMAAEKPKEAIGALAGNLIGLLYAMSESKGEKDITLENPNGGSASITVHAKNPLYYVHHIGPDDVHGPMTEMAAMRMANDINKSVALIREESTRAEFLPHSVALVKTAAQLGIEA